MGRRELNSYLLSLWLVIFKGILSGVSSSLSLSDWKLLGAVINYHLGWISQCYTDGGTDVLIRNKVMVCYPMHDNTPFIIETQFDFSSNSTW